MLSCELLAAVGHASAKSFASELACQEEVSYFIASTVVKDGRPACTSFCSPRDWKGWASTESSCVSSDQTEERDRIRTVDELQRRLGGCCNHASYARSCVNLGLHEAVHKAMIPDLEESIRKFARLVDKEKRENKGRLYRTGAPKVLGDVFAACVGATVMDADHMEAREMWRQHHGECAPLKLEVPHGRCCGPSDPVVTKDAFQEAVPHARNSIARWLVHIGSAGEAQARADFKLAFACSDVCLVEVAGRVHIGNSPRAITNRLCVEESTSRSESEDEMDEEEFIAENRTAEVMQSTPEDEGRIYCPLCDMELNGPTQWADHEIGKKHRKAVKRKQAEQKLTGKAEVGKQGTRPSHTNTTIRTSAEAPSPSEVTWNRIRTVSQLL